ncbi:hypothetical protein [Neogemmobacter tilapiae]|uniref:Uncharacterized protein n=1 Tax=Neogemmobacter tilapiae TaxID=875041 RepID=A0A918TZE6_9RHOB|nr:hypothetical protein [Gemmobacter tilapiae]GHC66757.1 hypothetical protein GCM10007315_34580 [Gemmobacter tilapiae]
MFDAMPNILDMIEDQMLSDGSPLNDALGHLSQLAAGRGACMCLEHPDLGVTVIADDAWHLDGAATYQKRQKHTVFSLQGHAGFDTISVLVGVADEDELQSMLGDCAIAAAAVDLVASVGAARALAGMPVQARLAA